MNDPPGTRNSTFGMRCLRSRWHEEHGLEAVELTLITLLMVLIILAAISIVTPAITAPFESVRDALLDAAAPLSG